MRHNCLAGQKEATRRASRRWPEGQLLRLSGFVSWGFL